MAEKAKVVIISSALAPDKSENKLIFDYFMAIVGRLSILLAGNDIEVVLKVPRNQRLAGQDQNDYILEMLNSKDTGKYSGLIIVPFNKQCIADSLGKLIEMHPKLPILTIDKGFIDESEIPTTPVSLPPFVMCDEEQGGRQAAQSLIYYLNENREMILCPHIALIEGLEGSELRVKGFKEELKSHFKDEDEYKLIGPIKARFRREIAKDQAKILLRDRDQNHKLNAFFCCNDEMALGVRDVLEEEEGRTVQEIVELSRKRGEGKAVRDKIKQRKKIKLSWLRSIRIIGFDGIHEARIRIKQKDKWLLNSVDVKINEQVETLHRMFMDLHETKNTKKRIFLQKCGLVVPEINQKNLN